MYARYLKLPLTLYFPMFPFDPPENIIKPNVFWSFQGDQKGTLGSKGLSKSIIGTANRTIQLYFFLLKAIFHTRILLKDFLLAIWKSRHWHLGISSEISIDIGIGIVKVLFLPCKIFIEKKRTFMSKRVIILSCT